MDNQNNYNIYNQFTSPNTISQTYQPQQNQVNQNHQVAPPNQFVQQNQVTQPNQAIQEIQMTELKLPAQQNQIIQPNQINVVNNQMHPTSIGEEILAVQSVLRSYPDSIVCPFCRQFTYTRTERKLNMVDVGFCLLCGLALWGVTHCYFGKDLNCYNAKHYCMKCNNLVTKYNSCGINY